MDHAITATSLASQHPLLSRPSLVPVISTPPRPIFTRHSPTDHRHIARTRVWTLPSAPTPYLSPCIHKIRCDLRLVTDCICRKFYQSSHIQDGHEPNATFPGP